MKLENIDGIGKATVEKLNTLGIRTVEDFASYDMEEVMSIKYLGASQIIKIYGAMGQKVTKGDVERYRTYLNKNNIDRTPVAKKSKVSKVNFVSKDIDEELFLDENEVKMIMKSDVAQNCWFTGEYNGETMPVVEAGMGTDLENLLIDAFPKYETNDIIGAAFKEIGLSEDYGYSDQYTLCTDCGKNLIGINVYPPDEYLVGDGEICCEECIEEDYPEAIALHKAFDISYLDMKYAIYAHYDNLEIIEVANDGAEYAIGTDDEADEAAGENIRESVWAFNAGFIANHIDDDGINDIKKRFEIMDEKNADCDDYEWQEPFIEEMNELGFGSTYAWSFLVGEKTLLEIIKEMQQECENSEDTIDEIIDDMDKFVKDAISADGRGHFLADYDFVETEQIVDGVRYYIYRIN